MNSLSGGMLSFSAGPILIKTAYIFFYFHRYPVFCNYLNLPPPQKKTPRFCTLCSVFIFKIPSALCVIQFMYNIFSPAFKQPDWIQYIRFVCHITVGHTSSKVRKLNSVTHIFLPSLHRNASSFYHPGLFSAICAGRVASVTTCYSARTHTYHTHTKLQHN